MPTGGMPPGAPMPGQMMRARGGKAGFAGGGIPTSEALDPWWTRSEERQMVQPEGLIKSTGAGRTDVHNINVPSGSYIVPADVTSGLGEGNTLSGASVMDRMMHSNPYGIEGGVKHGNMGPPRAPAPFTQQPQSLPAMAEKRGGKAEGHSGTVPIVVAGGEMLYHPETIIKKFGSLKKGHAALDDFVKKVRTKTAKTMLKLPGPKGASK